MNGSIYVLVGVVIGWLIGEVVKEVRFRLEMREWDRQVKRRLES